MESGCDDQDIYLIFLLDDWFEKKKRTKKIHVLIAGGVFFF